MVLLLLTGHGLGGGCNFLSAWACKALCLDWCARWVVKSARRGEVFPFDLSSLSCSVWFPFLCAGFGDGRFWAPTSPQSP